jgi:hypothetical protein
MSKPLEFDMIAGSQLRDTQGEMLSVEGADITDLTSGNGRINDNHGSGFFNSIGRVTSAKKIFTEADCENDRHTYYWNKVKAPYIYCAGVLYSNEDHPNARAAAAIIRNIHKSDIPLKMKASVEGGVVARGIKDPNLLARTKIHSVALTLTPANQATLVEPLNLDKSATTTEADQILIEKAKLLAKSDVPSFRHITRQATAESIRNKIQNIVDTARASGIEIDARVDVDKLVKSVLASRIADKVEKINELTKALTAGYGGAGAPTSRTGGAVIQSESMPMGRGFRYITCDNCGEEQVYATNQTKCRSCQSAFKFDKLMRAMLD